MEWQKQYFKLKEIILDLDFDCFAMDFWSSNPLQLVLIGGKKKKNNHNNLVYVTSCYVDQFNTWIHVYKMGLLSYYIINDK